MEKLFKSPAALTKLPTLLTLLAFTLMTGLVGCDKSGNNAANNAPAQGAATSTAKPATGGDFRILAGSELKDVAELVTNYGKTQNVNVVFDYTGTLDAVDRLSEKNNYDAVWISHGKYLQLVPAVKGQIKASEKTMYSRVVLGVKPKVVQSLGWKSGKTGWRDVVAAAKAGKFRFAMTNPTGSNTGFVALAGLAAELSGKGDALEEKDIPSDKLKELFAGQGMTAGSSGVLADMYSADAREVDGIINYESVIRSMVAKGQALEVIIPKEGVITADYPLMLLTSATPAKADFYAKLVAHVRADATQKQIATSTYRTPLSGSGSDEVVNELPFPSSITVVEAILKGFLDKYSKPANSYFVLDKSGSMTGERIAKLKEAMLTLAQGGSTASGRFSTFRAREHVEVTPFNHQTFDSWIYDLSASSDDNKATLARLAQDINSLDADGGTAIFASVASVYPKAQEALAKGGRTVSIVLLTDGENAHEFGLEEFKRFVIKQGEPKVPVFAVLYGEAKMAEMQELAATTGGRVFDARKVNLERVMKDIRTYQ